jgi:hypothetical protein
MVAIALLSGQELLLVCVPVIDFAILRQSLPFVRFDGYWVIADLTGIPDLFAAMGPFLVGFLPGRSRQRRTLPRLKLWVKLVFALYLGATIPLLGTLYVLLVRGIPSFVATTSDAVRFQTVIAADAWSRADFVQAAAAATQVAFLGLPLLGIGYVLYSTGRRSMLGMWRWSSRTPARRAIGALLTAGLGSLVAFGWGPQMSTVLPLEPAGVQQFTVTDRSHVNGSVAYEQDPPVGGTHAPIWLNCGSYDAPVAVEFGVHPLEHGAVWITYQPDLPSAQVATLRQQTHTHTHVLVSPYPGLTAPVVASAWGHQLSLDSADDARLPQFVRAFEHGPQAPEPMGPCSGGVGQVNLP